jgi:hypothetical protein
MNGYWVEIHPETFIIPFNKWNKEGTETTSGCYLGIKSSNYNFWSLGIPFIRNYYMVFDDSNS